MKRLVKILLSILYLLVAFAWIARPGQYPLISDLWRLTGQPDFIVRVLSASAIAVVAMIFHEGRPTRFKYFDE